MPCLDHHRTGTFVFRTLRPRGPTLAPHGRAVDSLKGPLEADTKIAPPIPACFSTWRFATGRIQLSIVHSSWRSLLYFLPLNTQCPISCPHPNAEQRSRKDDLKKKCPGFWSTRNNISGQTNISVFRVDKRVFALVSTNNLPRTCFHRVLTVYGLAA